MAKLETINYQPYSCHISPDRVDWTHTDKQGIEGLPQILWEDQAPWVEANLWALEQHAAFNLDPQTVRCNLMHLTNYAKWLEREDVEWWHFPERSSERCLVRYRGYLIKQRNEGLIAASTTTQRIAAVIRFYRWLQSRRLISSDWPMWNESTLGVKITNKYGIEHTLSVISTDLSIPNRKVASAVQLEDGLLPVSQEDAREIIEFADQNAPREVGLMLRLGFLTGMRLGTICDLKVKTLEEATSFPGTSWMSIRVGPGARPAVKTKFDQNGSVLIPKDLLAMLIQYSGSTRRLKRQGLADPHNRDLLFLTRQGAPYVGGKSRAVNVAISRLRSMALSSGVAAFRGFKFHRTRSSFATNLMRVSIQHLPASDAIQLVRSACLHKDEKTTLAYISFIENTKALEYASEQFFNLFTESIEP